MGRPAKIYVKNGSSPHTWGIPSQEKDLPLSGRFIPTYVGHTALLQSGQRYVCGSSPHTWGIQGGTVKWIALVRFIPTYVGHTQLGCNANVGDTVHPHIRGAYSHSSCSMIGGCGSSPHTWGIRSQENQYRKKSRFIPTYVGHTPARCGGGLWPPVHPHIRGAYAPSSSSDSSVAGSSPHTWGIQLCAGNGIAADRFIPTYVGHTTMADRVAYVTAGSSPHTWGIRSAVYLYRLSWRFIPTYVGHTCGRSGRFPPRPVHPHIRGAYPKN